ncbi:proton-coupled amino acid transporter-like protein CG1139 [Schistocerca nitens]|uniref:proton-coupled amino acid transporter-like protein CG1139 n=1 Tax=Schistocerca nitens TaxID=7011 RepID=UPI00211811B1|nr:proton-coupled amino acid transporter-like protein CG1139 [Schistocerca nitens]
MSISQSSKNTPQVQLQSMGSHRIGNAGQGFRKHRNRCSSTCGSVCGYYVPWMNDLDVRVYMVVMLPVFLGLVLVRQLKHMVPVSLAADAALLVSIVVILYYTLSGVPSINERALVLQFSQLPLFFSTVIFAKAGIYAMMPVENSMKNPHHFLGCSGVLNTAMSNVVSLYIVTGFCSYMKYGEATEGNVTLNLSSDEL